MASRVEAGDCVLGVDGGGTKTDAWLAIRTPTNELDVLGVGRAGPSNPCAVGPSEAHLAVEQAIGNAFLAAGVARQPTAAACLSIAGTGRPAERDEFMAWATRHSIAETVHLCNDAEPILACAGGEWGVALIAGTGSFALARNRNGREQRIGGWGYRMGDQGSGYAVAISALTAAARWADRLGPETALLDRFMRHFAVQSANEIITSVYAPEMGRREIADLAPLVVQQAESGDEVAQVILEQAADALSDMVSALCARLELPADCPLGVTGGFLLNCAAVRGQLFDQLARNGLNCSLTLVPQPVRGAVEIARREVRG